MKTTRKILASLLIGIAFFAFSCQGNSAEKLKAAQEEADEADENLIIANEEFRADMENYKQASEVQISENEQSIIAFKARIANSKKEAKEDYNKKIDALEQKNTDMKLKLERYQIEGKDQWEAFKVEFSNDMDELGNAIKGLNEDDVK